MNLSPKTQLWFRESLDDLKAGRALLNLSPDYIKKSAFFAQQSSEKAVKGYLTHNKKRFEKIHDMRKLAELVIALDPSLEPHLKGIEKLTVYAVAARYPDATHVDISTLTSDKVQQLLDFAQKIFDLLRQKCDDKS